VRIQWRAGIRLTMAVLVGIGTVGLMSPAAHAAATDVRINEVESNGGSPGDWVELTNNGCPAATTRPGSSDRADLSGVAT